MTGMVSKVTVTLRGFRHNFPRDVSALLVSPAGGNSLLMSHAGGAYGVTNLSLTFDDAADTQLPGTNMMVSGTFKPSAYGTAPAFPTPAPAGPFANALSGVAGGDPNGLWSLYILDDSSGDAGSVAQGWSLAVTAVNTTTPISDLAIGGASSPASVLVADPFVHTLTVTNNGPSPATGVVVTTALSEGVEYKSGTPSRGSMTLQGGSLVWVVGDLAVGATAASQLNLVSQLAGTATSTATVACDQTDLNTANNTAVTETVVSAPVAATLTGVLTNNEFRLTVTAQPYSQYIIQASADLAAWINLSTNTASGGGTIKYVDTNLPSFQRKYYRTERVTGQ